MSTEINHLNVWQNKILPFAIILLTVLIVFFIGFYFFETKNIQNSFLKSENYNVISLSKQLNNTSMTASDKLYNAELISLLNRHYSVSLGVRARILTLNLSFLTGMILCFMGGLFVLGKFSESVTSVTAGAEKMNLALSSSSPGIILSVIGVILISLSIFSKSDLSVEDKPVYIRSFAPSNGVPGEVDDNNSTNEENDTTANSNDTLNAAIQRLRQNTFKKENNDTGR